MLFLGNLPLQVGAFHPLGTNDIVLNRRLLGKTRDLTEKSHVFTILLHEYLHTLRFIDEHKVRKLTHKICKENFGKNHPVIQASLTGPWTELKDEDFKKIQPELDLEMVKNFERVEGSHII